MTAPKKFIERYRGRGVPVAGYYAAVSAIDHDVGRICEALEDLGLNEKTIVVYCADHGDTLRYRDSAHKTSCYEDAIRIPLVIRWPGQIKPGLIVNQMVGLQDLMPTILEWAGLEPPGHLHGKSLVPLLRGKAPLWREAYYVQNLTLHNIEQRCIRTSEWKLILNTWPVVVKNYSGENLLFNLVDDPEEEWNIYPRLDVTDNIRDLAGLLRKHAQDIDDRLGCELADKALLEMSKKRLSG